MTGGDVGGRAEYPSQEGGVETTAENAADRPFLDNGIATPMSDPSAPAALWGSGGTYFGYQRLAVTQHQHQQKEAHGHVSLVAEASMGPSAQKDNIRSKGTTSKEVKQGSPVPVTGEQSGLRQDVQEAQEWTPLPERQAGVVQAHRRRELSQGPEQVRDQQHQQMQQRPNHHLFHVGNRSRSQEQHGQERLRTQQLSEASGRATVDVPNDPVRHKAQFPTRKAATVPDDNAGLEENPFGAAAVWSQLLSAAWLKEQCPSPPCEAVCILYNSRHEVGGYRVYENYTRGSPQLP